MKVGESRRFEIIFSSLGFFFKILREIFSSFFFFVFFPNDFLIDWVVWFSSRLADDEFQAPPTPVPLLQYFVHS
jgi:hypothetical protein